MYRRHKRINNIWGNTRVSVQPVICPKRYLKCFHRLAATGLSVQSVASMRCLIIMVIHSGCHHRLHSWDCSIWSNKQLNDAMNDSALPNALRTRTRARAVLTKLYARFDAFGAA